MQQIGFTKWIKKTDNKLKYGVIKQFIQNERELFFHSSAVICNHDLLYTGILVKFQIECNQNKEQPININLLKFVGNVVKLKQRYDKPDYGFIKPIIDNANNLFLDNVLDSQDDIYFDYRYCAADTQISREKTSIVYGFKRINVREYKPVNIIDLQKETDSEIIEYCIQSENKQLWYPVFSNYLCSLHNIEAQIKLSLNKISQLGTSYSHFADSLPEQILIESVELRTYLSCKKHFEILTSYFLNQERDGIEHSHIQELEGVFKKANELELYCFISQITNSIKKHELIFPYLSKKEQVEIILESIHFSQQDECGRENLLLLLSLILDALVANDLIWKNIPDEILFNEIIWHSVPSSIKLDKLLEKLSQYQEEISKDSLLNQIGNVITQLPQNNLSYQLEKIPTWIKQHEEIFSLLPTKHRFNLAVESLNNSKATIENVITEVSYQERQSLIIPDWIKQIPSINSCLYQIPNVQFRKDAPEAEQIKQFVIQRNITNLCHFTTIENLSEIFKTGGLLSIQQLRRRNLIHHQIDEGRWDGRLNHICCSINSYNRKYMYHAKQRSDCWVLLFIKRDYLWKQNTLFSPINAATDCGAHIKQGFTGLQSMYADEVVDRSGLHTRQYQSDDCVPTCIQAEVMVYESISIEDIVQISVDGVPGNEQRVRETGWQGYVHVDRDLFG